MVPRTLPKAAAAAALLLCLAIPAGIVGDLGVGVGSAVQFVRLGGPHPPAVTQALPSGGNEWATLLPGTDVPRARSAHALAYDLESDRVVLFGGGGGGFLGDTSSYDVDTHSWTNESPASAPAPRIGAAMAYDSESDRILLFGGSAGGILQDDTWSYDLNTNTWTDITPAPRPSARVGHAMAYDLESDRIVLFGGFASGTYPDDTWTYDFNTLTWTDVMPATRPMGRTSLAMAYDSESDRVVLFGGTTATFFSDTWSYDLNGNAWTEMGPATVPPERYAHAMAYDSESDRIVMFAGFFSTANAPDTWSYDFNTDAWTDEAPMGPPVARYGHGMAYDSLSDRVVLFGGTDGTADLGDTWAYDLNANAWAIPVSTGRPPARFGHSVAYDSQSDRTILVGGLGSDGLPRDDTWSLDVVTSTWTNRTSATRPPGGDGAAAAYDAQSDRVIYYRAQQTWAYDFEANAWTNMNPPASPTAEAYHAMAYDSESDRVVLFGGSATGPGDLDETWSYHFETNTWTLMNPAVWPLALSLHAMAYDVQSDRIILFGGARTVGPSDETWAYDFNADAWTDLGPATAPTPRSGTGLVYDSESDRVILFGGADAAALSRETWSYDFETNSWLDLSPASPPEAREFHGMAYDAQSDLSILFGGSSSPGYPDETSVYRYYTVPSAPTGIQAVPGDGQVDLTWQAPVGEGGTPVTGYRIYRGLSSGGEVPLVDLGAVLTHSDAGLTNGVTYFYQVAALNAIGEGPRSAEASATPATVPDAPGNLAATPGDSVVVLGWDPPAFDGGSTVTGYTVYRGLTSGGEASLATIANVLTYTDSTVTNGVTYYYEVSATNSVGDGPRSTEVSATPVPAPTAPSAPQNLQAVPADSAVTLTWDPPASDGNSPITNYWIYRGTASGSLSLHAMVGAVLTYADPGLTNGVTYFYQVSAVNAIDEGPLSAEVSATPALLPGAPQNLQATPGNSVVVLAWESPASDGGSPITAFVIYRGTQSGGAVFLARLGVIFSYTDFSVTNGATYYYQVSAENAVGEGPRSAEASATPVSTGTAPSEPRSVQAVAGDASVTLTWFAPFSSGSAPITNYRVYRGAVSGTLSLHGTVGAVTSFTDSGLTNGVAYFYQVSAVNSVGEGPRSSEASATPSPIQDTTDPTIVITSPEAGATLTTTTVTVSGTASDDVALERVEISADGTTWILASGTASWSGSLTLGQGAQTIYARATDTSGNARIVTVPVTISPGTTIGGLVLTLEILIVLIVVGAAVAAAAALAVRRRRRRRRFR